MQQEGPLAQPVAYPRHAKVHRHNSTDSSGRVALGDLTGTLSTAQIADSAVTSIKILDGTIVAADLADGAVTSAKILDGTIATVDLAANAVTQTGLATANSSNPTTASTTFVDLTDMAVTLTTVGGELLVWANTSAHISVASTPIYLAIRLDTGGDAGEQVVTPASIGYASVLSAFYRYTGVGAGSHTVKARWKVGGGTGTAFGFDRNLLVLEAKR